MGRFVRGVIFIVCALVAQFLGQSDRIRPLLRMERIQPGEAVCVLVSDDGNYRMEKLFRSKNELYVGTISGEALTELQRLTGVDPLPTLSQRDIHTPLVADTFDELDLAILRERGWQQLKFLSPDSRKPYKESLDPLLRWFQTLQKERPGANKIDGSPSRCAPPPVQVATAENPSTANGVAASTVRSAFLFRIQTLHAYGGEVESKCTVVFRDGTYRAERSRQETGANRKDEVSQGQLPNDVLNELAPILDSTDLTSRPWNPDGMPPPSRESSLTVLSIPRESKVQNLAFSTAFRTLTSPHEIGGKSNMNYQVSDEKLLDPLKRWMKLHLDHEPFHEGTINNCSPIPASNTVNNGSR